MSGPDWETWLVEDVGYAVVGKKADQGVASLSRAERLTYCLWVADYGVRNAGDLVTAADVYPPFKEEAVASAERLGLVLTAATFRLPAVDFMRTYHERFDRICAEVAEALGNASTKPDA